MTGTTARGLPYPDPTDPLAQGADAIKNLAQSVDAALPNGGGAMLGALDPAKTIRNHTGWSGGATDTNGYVRLAAPAGATSIVAIAVTPTWLTADNQYGWFPLVRVDISSVAEVVIQVMSAAGTPVASHFIGYAYTIAYQ